MAKRIKYVGTLIDLAAIFEPEIEVEVEMNFIRYEINETSC
jgi:hypothetical protein